MAGSTIPPETARAFLDLGVKPQNIYGMTENGSHQYTMPDDDVEAITSTCGKACHGYETRLWDQENPDVEAAPGAIGEIGTRGALLMLGYFDNQAATENSFNAGGWFMSGDLGPLRRRRQPADRRPQEGPHHPRRPQHPSRAHREPRDLRIRPCSRPRRSPCPTRGSASGCAWRSSRATARASTATSCCAHLDGAGLSKYDMPEYFIAMDAFPLTASGKILKRELVEWTKSGRIKPTPVRSRVGKA